MCVLGALPPFTHIGMSGRGSARRPPVRYGVTGSQGWRRAGRWGQDGPRGIVGPIGRFAVHAQAAKRWKEAAWLGDHGHAVGRSNRCLGGHLHLVRQRGILTVLG